MRRDSLIITSLVAVLALPALAQDAQKPASPSEPAQGDRPQRPRNQDGQPGGGGGGGRQGGPQLSAERSAAAWKLQAEGVAKRFDLDPTSTNTLVDAYVTQRKGNQAESDKLREEMRKEMENDAGGDRREAMRKMMTKQDDQQKSSREALRTSIAGVLKGEQLDKAMKSLGAFNRQWDQAVDAVAFFKLDAAKQQKALDALEDYVVTGGEIMAKARAMFEIGDMSGGQKLREEADKARQQCIDAVKPMLTQEQAIKFEEALPRGMGGMRGPGGFGGGPGGGGGPRGGN